MMENIRKGIREGLFRDDIDVDFTSRIYFTGLTGVKDTDIFPSTNYEINAVNKQFIEYHIRSIATEKGLKTLKTAIEKY